MSELKSPQKVSAAVVVSSFEEQVTSTFRQAACLLAARATKEARSFITANEKAKDGPDMAVLPSLQVAQHLLIHHPGFVPTQLDMRFRTSSETSTSLAGVFAINNETNSAYLPCCKQCGSSLQANCNGTTIRVLPAPRMSRSQRRRFKRKQHHKTSKIRKNDPLYARIWEYGQALDDSVRLPEQCLQVTCGSCGSACFVPTRLDTKESFARKDDKSVLKAMASTSTLKNPAAVPAKLSIRTVATKATGNTDDLNFIRLPSAKTAAAPQVPLQSLDQPRKKKKPKKGDNPLMDFLSSLNN